MILKVRFNGAFVNGDTTAKETKTYPLSESSFEI